jgi:hypothetical protein
MKKKYFLLHKHTIKMSSLLNAYVSQVFIRARILIESLIAKNIDDNTLYREGKLLEIESNILFKIIKEETNSMEKNDMIIWFDNYEAICLCVNRIINKILINYPNKNYLILTDLLNIYKIKSVINVLDENIEKDLDDFEDNHVAYIKENKDCSKNKLAAYIVPKIKEQIKALADEAEKLFAEDLKECENV